MTARRWAMPSLLALVSRARDRVDRRRTHHADWNVWSHQDAIGRTILLELRLPRALLGVVIGAALGLAGAAMQGYLRNPLADPGTLGVSSMAALGAVLSIFFGIAGSASVGAADRAASLGGMLGMAALVPARRHDRQRAHAGAVRASS